MFKMTGFITVDIVEHTTLHFVNLRTEESIKMDTPLSTEYQKIRLYQAKLADNQRNTEKCHTNIFELYELYFFLSFIIEP